MNFTPWAKAVLMAYVRRSLHDSPDYHPPRAVRIYKRWPHIIDAALEAIERGHHANKTQYLSR